MLCVCKSASLCKRRLTARMAVGGSQAATWCTCGQLVCAAAAIHKRCRRNVTATQQTLAVVAVLQETIRQQEWKIERLTKDNRALEASNCELRAQLEALKEENLQVRLVTSSASCKS